jgi:endonuclease/exonuclease/phosphatase family metal-dependent hydrolase
MPPRAPDADTAPDTALICATWNIHRGRGADGRIDPDRIARAIMSEVCAPGPDGRRPDILALQEADGEQPPFAGFLPMDRIEAGTGLVHAQPPPLRWGAASHGFHGNILMLAPHLRVTDGAVVDLPGHYPRGAVVLDLSTPAGPLRAITLHLSLSQPLRIVQMRTLAQHLDRRRPLPLLILGDLNEWRPWGGLARATFPARAPLLPLDRILADRSGSLTDVRTLNGPLARSASDHRPLRATLTRPA